MAVKFSVVIPLFNKEAYVLKTLKSVCKQTYTDFEIIVVNDCSTDASLDIVTQLNDIRIRIIEHTKNLGLSATRNSGIEAARNDYIAFLDADDCWDANFLASIVTLIKKFPNHKAFATHYRENYNGTLFIPKTKLFQKNKGDSFTIPNFFKLNLGRLILTQSCLVVHKAALNELDSYNPSITFAEDIDFYIRCFSKFDLAYYYKPCHTQNTTVSNSLTQSSTSDKTYPDLKKYLGKSDELDAFIYFYMYCFCQRLKLENRSHDVKTLRKKIDIKHLNSLQVILLYQPKSLYALLIKIKKKLMIRGVQPTTYSS